MSDLKDNNAEPKKTSNKQAVIILVVFIVMFVGLVAFEVATKK